MNNLSTQVTAAQVAAFRRRLAKVDPILANLMRAAGKCTMDPGATHTPFADLKNMLDKKHTRKPD